jgi:nucleotide-binding universal stress UspA family protein
MNATLDRIVVGVDGSTAGGSAVEWGARQARRTGASLLLLHAYTVAWPVGMSDPAVLPPPDESWTPSFLDDARAHVEQNWPEVVVSALAVPSSPAAALVSASRTASLVVVGAHGRSAVGRLLLGSVSRHVTAHAHCPAVVVRGTPKSVVLPVAVGIDDSPTAHAALAWAFQIADDLHVPLRVFHAWEEPTTTGYGMWAAPPSLEWELREEAQHLMTKTLAAWAERYPLVEVHELVVQEHPVTAVVQESHRCQLVVLGTHGRGAFAGMAIGSIPAAAVHQTDCPVVVVPPEDRGTA